VAEQDRPDGRRRDPDAQLQQLSAEALVAPPGVLGAKANDEGVDLGVDRWPAGAPSPFVRPLPPDELPVPAEESLRPDNERRPLASGHRLARRRQQEPVKTAQTGALHLALQHPHLVSKDQELDLPSLIWALPGSEDAANEEVDEREQHGSPFPSRRAHATGGSATRESWILNPSRTGDCCSRVPPLQRHRVP
jgi:hypothetical protein